MSDQVQPLRADKFLRAALEYMEPLRGTYIYDATVRDLLEKTERVDGGEAVDRAGS